MNKDEALKMAIRIMQAFDNEIPTNSTKEAINACKEALEEPSMTYEQGFDHGYEAHGAEQMADACKEALEQPAQEPVAWINEDELPDEYPYDEMFKHSEIVYGVRVFPVYPPKHQWQGLTDDEIIDMYFQANIYPQPHGFIIDFIRAIEQALKEKNCGI